MLSALVIELTAAGTGPAAESWIAGAIPEIGNRSPQNPW